MRLVRLNKVLMKALNCSRKEADAYIRSGYVKVDSRVVTELGTKIRLHDDDGSSDFDGIFADFKSFTSTMNSAVGLGGGSSGAPDNRGGGMGVRLTEIGQKEIRTIQADPYATVLYHKPLGVVSCQPSRPGQIPAIRNCTQDKEYIRRRGRDGNDGDNDNDNVGNEDGHGTRGRAWYEPSRGDGGFSRRRRRSSSSSTKERVVGVPSPQERSGWKVAGRLDVNSTGLLVLTTSGALVSQIIGNRSAADDDNSKHVRVEKEYLVRVPQLETESRDVVIDKLNQLRSGVLSKRDRRPSTSSHADDEEEDNERDDDDEEEETEEELLTAVRVRKINERQLQIVLDRGRRHHIRRMCRAVGWDVLALKRVRVGSVRLDDLPYGFWRYLRPGETFLWPNQP